MAGIRVIKNGTLLDAPFLDVSDLSQQVEFNGDERGLLGLAFHPGYAENGRFFVHYTDKVLDHGAVVEYHATPGGDVADPGPVKILYTVTATQYGNHNGGQLAFGPDGHLYIGFGGTAARRTIRTATVRTSTQSSARSSASTRTRTRRRCRAT